MTLSIVQQEFANRQEWETTARSCSYATYFHSPEWIEIFSSQYGKNCLASRSLKVAFNDGKKAIVVLACRKRSFLQFYFSSVGTTYGGWISSDELTHEHDLLLVPIIKRFPNIVWRENPFNSGLAAIDLPGASIDFTQAINLKRPISELRQLGNLTHRTAVKKATQRNITVRTASSIDDWDGHFKAYQDSIRRWRSNGLRIGNNYPWCLFKAMHDRKSPHIQLWLAEQEGNLLASQICFYWNKHAVAWNGASLEKYYHLRASDVLYSEIIMHAAQNGYEWFDFNPSGGFEGVVQFKANCGAVRMQSRVLVRRSLSIRAMGALRKIFAKGKRKKWVMKNFCN